MIYQTQNWVKNGCGLGHVIYFSVERCNMHYTFCYCHKMSSVCRLSVMLKLGSCSFHYNVAQCLNSACQVDDVSVRVTHRKQQESFSFIVLTVHFVFTAAALQRHGAVSEKARSGAR